MKINDKESLLQEKLADEYNRIISSIMFEYPVFNNILQNEIDIHKLLQIVNQSQSPSTESSFSIPPNINSTSIRIKKINVQGFRGRTFELICYDDDHTIFVMDNNTGKTTTLALLQWCFGYNTTEATTKFYHHTDQDRRVLDYNYLDVNHKVKIEVTFTGTNLNNETHKYLFTRTANGITTIDAPPNELIEIKKKIKQLENLKDDELKEKRKEIQFRVREQNVIIHDSLNIDDGKIVKENNEVHDYLAQTEGFSLNRDYDVCFFDAEQVQSFSRESTKQLDKLRTKLSEKIQTYYTQSCFKKVNLIKNLIQKEAGGRKNISRTSSTLEKKLQTLNDEINTLNTQIIAATPKVTLMKEKKQRLEGEKKQLWQDLTTLDNEHSTNLKHAKETIENNINNVINSRNSIAAKINNWRTIPSEYFTTLINDLNEKSNLPEHIRDSLIDQCLNSNPPTCQVCKQPLDETAKTNIKKLQASLAKDSVYNFLSQKFPYDNQTNIDTEKESITSSISSFKNAKTKETSNIDNKKQQLNTQLEDVEKERTGLENEIETLSSDINTKKQILQAKKDDKTKKFSSVEELKKWIPLQEQIDKIEQLLAEGQEHTGKLALELINEILAFAVPDATLGEQQATLTNRGLESKNLTPKGTVVSAGVGVATEQITGYILTEALNDTKVAVIDSPAGAIGKRYRKSFAKHLRDQNQQVIAFCTDAELDDFAKELSHKDPIYINQNKTSD